VRPEANSPINLATLSLRYIKKQHTKNEKGKKSFKKRDILKKCNGTIQN
jgi:hypothetical protein